LRRKYERVRKIGRLGKIENLGFGVLEIPFWSKVKEFSCVPRAHNGLTFKPLALSSLARPEEKKMSTCQCSTPHHFLPADTERFHQSTSAVKLLRPPPLAPAGIPPRSMGCLSVPHPYSLFICLAQ